jgi:putative spermidine/putrescine transport system substrate-binding protein
VTYPAPPDFTGSAFVRQAVAALGEDEAFALLAELKPLQWREGVTLPGSEAELSRDCPVIDSGWSEAGF